MINMSTGIIPIIKQAAVEAVQASNPANFVYGIVTGIDPLQITITPSLILNENDGVLKLCRNVTEYSLMIDINWTQPDDESEAGMSTIISGTYQITLDNALKLGDNVLLAKVQGGQSYIVVDRVV
mgnify:CR=1 FL=1